MTDVDEYVEASNKARWLLFAYVIAVVLLVLWFRSLINDIRPLLEGGETELQLAIASVKLIIQYLLIVILLHALVLSVMLIKLGIQAIGEGRFPSTGSWVLTRTKVLTGAKARRKAMLCYLLAFLVWLPMAIPWYLSWLLEEVIAR